jgi:hypothetical protein
VSSEAFAREDKRPQTIALYRAQGDPRKRFLSLRHAYEHSDTHSIGAPGAADVDSFA